MRVTLSSDAPSLTGATDYMSGNNPDYSDDGCDWTAWLVWAMRERCRIRSGEFLLPPRPVQVTAPAVTGKGRTRRKQHNRLCEGGEKD